MFSKERTTMNPREGRELLSIVLLPEKERSDEVNLFRFTEDLNGFMVPLSEPPAQPVCSSNLKLPVCASSSKTMSTQVRQDNSAKGSMRILLERLGKEDLYIDTYGSMAIGI